MIIKKSLFALGVLAACACLSSSVHASLSFNSTIGGGAYAGANYVNFDFPVGDNGGVSQVENGLSLTLDSNAQVVNGSVSGQFAAPFISGSNSQYFNSNAAGADTSNYVTSGSTGAVATAKVTMSFGSGYRYFGLLWGSVDTYNTLSFYNGATLVGQLTGAQVLAANFGAQDQSGTTYVNIVTDTDYNRVEATSTQFAFEFDNVAYGAVPEPAAVLAWGVLGLVGVVAVRRARRRA